MEQNADYSLCLRYLPRALSSPQRRGLYSSTRVSGVQSWPRFMAEDDFTPYLTVIGRNGRQRAQSRRLNRLLSRQRPFIFIVSHL